MMANNNQGNGNNQGENPRRDQPAIFKAVQQKNPPSYTGKGDPIDSDNRIH